MRSAEYSGCMDTSPGALAHEHRPHAARCRVVVSRSMQLYLAETDGHSAARFVRKDRRWMGDFEGFDGCMDGRLLGAALEVGLCPLLVGRRRLLALG